MTKKLVSFDDQAEPGQGLPAAVKAELNDTYGPDKVQEVIVAEAEAPSGVVTRRGGKTKSDGQNIRHFRRPTLAVERMWPNNLIDHQIVYVDETVREAYSVGQDQRFRKATWASTEEEASNWGYSRSSAPDGVRWCANGLFLKVPDSGELLMDAWTVSTSTATLIRSTDDGVTWSTVWTSPANGKYILGPQGVVRDEVTGHLYLPEYDTNPDHTTIDIWRSTDKGATWSVWVSMPRSTSIAPGAILHWHSARYDHVSQRVYFLAGDHQADAGIYRTNDAGDGIEPVVLNKQTSALSAAASRAVDIMFFPTHIAWPVDGSGGGQNHVYRMARDQIGATNPVVEKVAAIDNNGWWCIPARNDKSMWLFTTSTEWPSSTNSDEGLVHMYAVSDNGGTVDEVAVVNVDGQRTAFASVSGFSGYAGSGDSFWLRAHTHRMFPNTVTSSFQLRARLGFGVVPLIRPAPKSFSYGQQSRSTPPVSLAPGESRAFAFAYVPKRTKAMSIFDVGSLGMNPLTYGATKVEIWNVTTNTKAYEHVGPSVLTSSNSDTAHRQTVIHFNPLDVIEFRVTNIHASATVGCAAYVVFGWSFS